MCFLGIYINNDASSDEYQLILANNRDEFFNRPTETVSFWGKHRSCISSIDVTPGKEGGTWLGMNQSGKIASLLNILGILDPKKEGRGHLVSDYLISDVGAAEYLEHEDKNKESYNAFQLVLLERRNDEYHIHYLTNSNDVNIPPTELNPDSVHIFTNSKFNQPWKKNEWGHKLLSNVVKEFNKISEREELIQKLFEDVLDDRNQNMPDPVLEEQMEAALRKDPSKLSSICVNKFENYGSRTKTVILVDGDGGCEYIEKSMVEPLNPQYEKNKWETKFMKFELLNEDKSRL